MDYQYPIDYTWTTDETIKVIQFFQVIEDAYEKGVNRDKLMTSYRSFKEVVPSKAEEKKLFAEFEQMSGYSPYRTVTKAKEESGMESIRMKSK